MLIGAQEVQIEGSRVIRQGQTPAAMVPAPALSMETMPSNTNPPRTYYHTQPCIQIDPVASLSAITPTPAALPSGGGPVKVALAGKHLPAGTTLAVYENAAPTALSATATGAGTAATATLQLPANETDTAKTYTIKAVLPVLGEVAAPSATVTVAAKEAPPEAKPEAVAVQGVTLNMGAKVLKKGRRVTLKATVAPQNATEGGVTWASSNTKVATVSSKGVVTAKKTGKATITAKAGGKTAKCTIAVRADAPQKAVKTLKLNRRTATMRLRGRLTLKATLNPEKPLYKKVVWASSNPDIATVNARGVVRAKAKGKVKITATSYEGGKKAVCTLTVR